MRKNLFYFYTHINPFSIDPNFHLVSFYFWLKGFLKHFLVCRCCWQQILSALASQKKALFHLRFWREFCKKILRWQIFFSFQHSKELCLLVCRVYICFSVCNVFLTLTPFNIFSLSLGLNNFIIIFLCMVFFMIILHVSHYISSNLEEFWPLFKYFFLSPTLLLLGF